MVEHCAKIVHLTDQTPKKHEGEGYDSTILGTYSGVPRTIPPNSAYTPLLGLSLELKNLYPFPIYTSFHHT